TTDALGNSCAASAADALTDTSTRTAVGPESGLAQARRPLLISGVEDRPRGRALLTGLGGRGDLLGVLAVVVRQVPAALTEVLLFLLELFPLALRDVFPPLERLALVEQLFAVLLQLLLVLLDGLVVAQDLRDRLALAVVDGHHRDAARTVGLLGDDLHVAVLDPDLAVLARRVDLTVRPLAAGHVLPGPLRTERTTGRAADRSPLGLRAFLGNVFRVLVRVEVQVVGLRAALAVVDRHLHLAGRAGLGDRDLVVALAHRGGVLIVDVLDRLAGLRVDRVRLAGLRVDLERLPGNRIRAVIRLVGAGVGRRRRRVRRTRATRTGARRARTGWPGAGWPGAGRSRTGRARTGRAGPGVTRTGTVGALVALLRLGLFRPNGRKRV